MVLIHGNATSLQQIYHEAHLWNQELPGTEETMKEVIRLADDFTKSLKQIQPDPSKYSKEQINQLDSVFKMAISANRFLETSES